MRGVGFFVVGASHRLGLAQKANWSSPLRRMCEEAPSSMLKPPHMMTLCRPVELHRQLISHRRISTSRSCLFHVANNNNDDHDSGNGTQHIQRIQTNAKTLGPYSPAVIANGFVFVSGQIPMNTETNELNLGTIDDQTALVLKNLETVLHAAGTSMDKVVKTTVYLKDMHDFARMNVVFEEYFGTIKPARAAVEVARLPKDVAVEIEAIAVV
eukprot:m.8618 g.8618  ORF g.8618 m.8618 type:complete len:212 (-) comp3200_c0_seq1:207-842(-)